MNKSTTESCPSRWHQRLVASREYLEISFSRKGKTLRRQQKDAFSPRILYPFTTQWTCSRISKKISLAEGTRGYITYIRHNVENYKHCSVIVCKASLSRVESIRSKPETKLHKIFCHKLKNPLGYWKMFENTRCTMSIMGFNQASREFLRTSRKLSTRADE